MSTKATSSTPGEKDEKTFSKDWKGKKGAKDKTNVSLFIPPGQAIPFAEELERGALSCMLQDPEHVLDEAIVELADDDFYLPSTRTVFSALKELRAKGRPIDTITLVQYLDDQKELENVGGAHSISELRTLVPLPDHYSSYSELLRHKGTLRRIISTCAECIDEALDGPEDSTPVLDTVERRVLEIRRDLDVNEAYTPFKDRVMSSLDRLDQMARNPDSVRGVETGFTELDKLTFGFQSGDMIVIAARPSMGKTAITLNMIMHSAVKNQVPCAFFSLEMPAEQLVTRLLCTQARVNLQELRQGMKNKGDLARLSQATAELKDAKLYIDDAAGVTIDQVRAKARRFVHDLGVQIIAIDYLQLMKSNSRRAQDNRQVEIAEISGGIKEMAKELEVPVIVVAQLNRQVDARKGKRPVLSDLRESGAIEQDADLVGLLTRDDYAGNKDEEEDEDEEESNHAELVVAKHRNGATGDVPLVFHKEFMLFEDRPPEAGGGWN